MPTSAECICCREVDRVALKIQESELKLPCITDHEGFAAVCLDVWVLQTAYYSTMGAVLQNRFISKLE